MIKYSVMSGKLQGIPALNTSPLNNKYCQSMAKKKDSICSSCYSIKMLSTYRKSAEVAFVRYGKFLSDKVHPIEYLPKTPNALYIRFSAHGELINSNHLINLINICKLAPNTTFTLWTKRKSLINKVFKKYAKPSNMILIYSALELDKTIEPPKHFNKVFIVQNKKDTKTNCFGGCIDCLKCYDLKDKTKHIYEEIK